MSRIPTGRVHRKQYRDREGRVCTTENWHLKYYCRGKVVELSSGTPVYDEALAMLRRKMAEAAIHGEHVQHPELVRMNQLFDLLMDDYSDKGNTSIYDTRKRVDKHLRPFFGETRVQEVGTAKIRAYVDRRRQQKATAATVNKELAFVRRAMRLGARHEPPLVLRVPHFQMLKVDNVREGLLEHDKYKLLRDALPSYARIAFVIAYHTGARKGEICQIRKERVNLKTGRIELPGRTTKNKRPRYLPIYGNMRAELDMSMSITEKSKCPFLVQHKGKRIADFEKTWDKARIAAGVPEALFHDLRRTACTNMIDAGMSEREAMEISGHKTRAVFDRYNVVSDRRMQENAQKLEAHLKSLEAPATGEDDGGRQKTGASTTHLV